MYYARSPWAFKYIPNAIVESSRGKRSWWLRLTCFGNGRPRILSCGCLDGAECAPSRVSLGRRKAGAISNHAGTQVDDADCEAGGAGEKEKGRTEGRNGELSQLVAHDESVLSVVEELISVTRQAHRSQSQQPPVSLSRRRSARAPSIFPAPMSGQRASVDDWELELEAKRRRRRSVYYDTQRAPGPGPRPSASFASLPRLPAPQRKEVFSQQSFWEALDGSEATPPTTSTGPSETPSRMKKWKEALKGVFRF